MLFKTQSRINTKLILEHPIWSSPSSQNAIVDNITTKYFNAKYTILKQKEEKNFLRVHLPNITVLLSIHEDNIQLASWLKERNKAHVFPNITFCALILVS